MQRPPARERPRRLRSSCAPDRVARVLQQERIVAVRRIDFGVADRRRLSSSARTISRLRAGAKRQSVVNLTSRKRAVARASAAPGRRRTPRRVEIVERARDQQVGVGVEVIAELVALIAQVALDLEIDALRRVDIAPSASQQLADRTLGHHVVAQVRDVADHARDAQTAPRHHAVRVVVAAVEVRVGHDRPPRDFVERDVLRRQVRRARDHYGMPRRAPDTAATSTAPACRPGCRPSPPQTVDAEPVEQPRLRIDPVFDRDHRKIARRRRGRCPGRRASGRSSRSKSRGC